MPSTWKHQDFNPGSSDSKAPTDYSISFSTLSLDDKLTMTTSPPAPPSPSPPSLHLLPTDQSRGAGETKEVSLLCPL